LWGVAAEFLNSKAAVMQYVFCNYGVAVQALKQSLIKASFFNQVNFLVASLNNVIFARIRIERGSFIF